MSAADLLKKTLSGRFLPSATAFARKLYSRVDPALAPTLAIVVVPTQDVDWIPFEVGLPTARADKLLANIKHAVNAGGTRDPSDHA